MIGGMNNAIQTRALTNSTLDQFHKILRLRQVLDTRGIQKSTHYSDIKNGLFTPPVRLGVKASGWPLSEVAALNAARIAGRPDNEIRALVQRLVAARAEPGVAQ